jgi:hypothetical protein
LTCRAVPAVDTVNAYCLRVKVAVTLLPASIVTVQAPVPEQAPDQPPNCEPEPGVADRRSRACTAHRRWACCDRPGADGRQAQDELRLHVLTAARGRGANARLAVPTRPAGLAGLALYAATATAVDIAFVTIFGAVGAVEHARSAIGADVARGASVIETTQRAVDGILTIDEPVAIIVDTVVAFILPWVMPPRRCAVSSKAERRRRIHGRGRQRVDHQRLTTGTTPEASVRPADGVPAPHPRLERSRSRARVQDG